MLRQNKTHAPHANAIPRTITIGLPIVVGLVAASCAPQSLSTTAVQRCADSVQATVSQAKPTVTVVYNEPTQDQAGRPMAALSKTTIYYDVGNGRIRAKEVPSTQPSGGGHITETITVPIPHNRQVVLANICVTATDRHGNESR